MRGLSEKVVIITGARIDNLGGATADRLAAEGAKVLVADIDRASAEALASKITSAGGSAVATTVDVTDEHSVRAMVDLTVDAFGGVDGLFNASADRTRLSGADSDLLTISDDVWHRTFDVTLTGYLYATRHVFPHMIARGGGSIVNTMSIVVWRAEPVRVAYGTAKAAVEALTRHTAELGGKQGIRCNAIAPGVIRTPLSVEKMPDEVVAGFLKEVRAPRLGQPSDVASAVAFLMSDDATWINAQTIAIDGGTVIR